MNQFQKKTLSELNGLSQKINLEFNILEEKEDKYIEGKIGDYQVWIYPEGGADFMSPNYDQRFEKYDYENEDQLIGKLVEKLEEGIINKDKYALSPQKSPPPILNHLFSKVLSLFKADKK